MTKVTNMACGTAILGFFTDLYIPSPVNRSDVQLLDAWDLGINCTSNHIKAVRLWVKTLYASQKQPENPHFWDVHNRCKPRNLMVFGYNQSSSKGCIKCWQHRWTKDHWPGAGETKQTKHDNMCMFNKYMCMYISLISDTCQMARVHAQMQQLLFFSRYSIHPHRCLKNADDLHGKVLGLGLSASLNACV